LARSQSIAAPFAANRILESVAYPTLRNSQRSSCVTDSPGASVTSGPIEFYSNLVAVDLHIHAHVRMRGAQGGFEALGERQAVSSVVDNAFVRQAANLERLGGRGADG
jgi:hypothetical protein